MKYIIVSVLFAFHLSMARANPTDDVSLASFDAQVKALEEIKASSSARDYTKLFGLLSINLYQSGITEKEFASRLAKKRWELIELKWGTIVQEELVAYVPVHGVARTADGLHPFDVVVFLRKEKNEWKLLNFPFAEGTLPNWLIYRGWFK